MEKYYINSNGRLRRKENTLYFEYSDTNKGKKAIPINNVDSIYLFGEVDLNTKVINLLSQYEITLHFFNYYGFYGGSFYPREKNVSGDLLVKQVQFYLDEKNRFFLAASFVDGATFHILRNLRKSNIDNELIENFSHDYLTDIAKCNNIQSLMAVEGGIREIYYSFFNTLIKEPKFIFNTRQKNPPVGPVNALISFGNSMLYTAILSEIYKTQLNPTISYLHTPSEKRFSLSLDIADIFKPLIIDPIIFSLINLKILTLEDFDSDLNYSYLNEKGRIKFIKAFEEKLSTTIKHRTLKRKTSYRYLLRLECYKLIKHLISDEIYKPFKAWW
jgi:CRISPR-associated protein Cas1